jgi:phage FluMu protein Com
MVIEFRCLTCNTLLRVPSEHAGGRAKCPKCESVAAIPALQTALPEVSPPSGGSPFAFRGATESADVQNPYQSPADYSAGWDGVQIGVPAAAIRPTRIDLGDIFRRTWEIFKRQWGTCLGGVFLALVLTLAGYVMLYVPLVAGLALGNNMIAGILFVFGYVGFLLYMTWLTAGVLQFLLGIARGHQPSIAELFRGGSSWPRMLGAMFLLWLISFGIALGCLLPALALLAISREAFQVAYVAGILLANVVNSVVFLMFSQAFFLIIDRRMGVIDAFRRSREITHGNKLWLFILWLAAGALLVVSAIPCGLGLLFTVPYFALMVPVIYLVMTGQPTADQSHYYYPPAPTSTG